MYRFFSAVFYAVFNFIFKYFLREGKATFHSFCIIGKATMLFSDLSLKNTKTSS